MVVWLGIFCLRFLRVPTRLVCLSSLPVILLALSMEENVRSCGPAHVLGNTALVPLLETSNFFIVAVDDRVPPFFFAWFSKEWACVLLLYVVLCYNSVLPQTIYFLS